MTPPVRLTYYLEILSSWCFWSEPTWTHLQARYEGQVEFDWKIALLPPEAFPVSRAQCDWFYRRSGSVMRSPFVLNSGWFEFERSGQYDAPNLVAEAGRDFGFNDDRLRTALTKAAVRDGRKIGDIAEAVAVAAEVTGVAAKKIRERAESADIRSRVDASTAEFLRHQINQRPAFVVTDAIGDKAVFSGLVKSAPLVATIDVMLEDCVAYASHAAHFGEQPMM